MDTATSLLNGRVLIAGCAATCSVGATELFDPQTGTFSLTGPRHAWYTVSTATLLINGTVLFVEANESGLPYDAEVYDPASGTFSDIGFTSAVHEFSAATRLPDWTVLIAGGQSFGGNGIPVTELDVPATGTFAFAGNMTTGRHEMYSIYHNNHDLTFDDLAFPLGIGSATRLMSGWGVKFFDYDNDGMMDLFVANGHPDDRIEQHSTQVTYQEPFLLFHNNGKGLENVSSSAGPVFNQAFAARGLAVGDFDNNGAVDVLVTVNNGPPILLKNVAAERNHWLGLHLVGRNCNPDAIGARITWQAGDLRRCCLKTGGGSYLSSHDPRVVLGLGAQSKIEKLEIRWPLPSGRVETFADLPVDRYVTVVEGKGLK